MSDNEELVPADQDICTDRGLGTFLSSVAHGGNVMSKITHAAENVLHSSEGIKKLLKRAAEEAVRILGVKDGYFLNELVKILVPPKLDGVAKTLKKFHMDSYIQKFILSMNRAAELAATSALPIFQKFIKGLNPDDVSQMIGGEGSAATNVFRQKSERDLQEAYAPIVAQSMSECNVTRNFQEVQSHVKKIPGLSAYNVDIHQYTVKKALDGLFLVLGQQEARIRKDPAGELQGIVNSVMKK